MKTGKEIKTHKFKDYSVVFGSVDNRHSKAIYINISAWSQPKSDEDINYIRAIRNVSKMIKQYIYNTFDSDPHTNFIKDRTIVDLDIRESGIRFGKRSFMSCEITLFLNVETPVNTEEMQADLVQLSTSVIRKIFDKNDYFRFHKKKK